MIRYLIKYFNEQIDFNSAVIFGLIFCLNTIILGIIHHPYFHNILRLGMQTRIAICGLIYRKVRFRHLKYFSLFIQFSIFIGLKVKSK